MDLAEQDPTAILTWCRLLGDTPCTVLVAGGDGTIAWLLNIIHKLQLNVNLYLIYCRYNLLLKIKKILFCAASSSCSNTSFRNRK